MRFAGLHLQIQMKVYRAKDLFFVQLNERLVFALDVYPCTFAYYLHSVFNSFIFISEIN